MFSFNNFAKLQELVLQNKLTIYYELSLPRSNSTAWQIAICEASEIDGQINEPSFYSDFKCRDFNAGNEDNVRTFEDYCAEILEHYRNLVKKKAGSDEGKNHVGMVVNDLVHSIKKNELQKILALTRKIIITIRDPRIQGLSALTRIINDSLDASGGGNISTKMALELANKPLLTDDELRQIIGPGKNKINPSHILKAFPANTALTPELLQKVINDAVQRATKDYIELCWSNIQQQLTYIREHCFAGSAILIIDGGDLTKYPEAVMRLSAQALNVTYSPKMVYEWTKANKSNFYCVITKDWGELAITNHWNGPVRNSTKIEAKPESINSKTEVNAFPECMRDPLKKALAIYADIEKLKIQVDHGIADSDNRLTSNRTLSFTE